MPKYSFVIPVYNTEKYLDECIKSILAQTLRDFEVILVDDGSTDGSGDICDRYAKENDRVQTLHFGNAGLSMARNRGLERAAGEYVIFLDSDDYWAMEDGLAKIDRALQPDTDVLIFAASDFIQTTHKLIPDRYDYPQALNTLDSEDCLMYMIEHDLFNAHACKKVFRKAFLLENGLYFKAGIRTEDVELWIRAVNCLPRYMFLNERIYVYRHRSNSITTSIDAGHLIEFGELIKEISRFTYTNERIRDALLSYDAYQLILLIAHSGKISREDRKQLLEDMAEYRYLLKYRMYPRTRMVSLMIRVLGMNLSQKVLTAYLRYVAV